MKGTKTPRHSDTTTNANATQVLDEEDEAMGETAAVSSLLWLRTKLKEATERFRARLPELGDILPVEHPPGPRPTRKKERRGELGAASQAPGPRAEWPRVGARAPAGPRHM